MKACLLLIALSLIVVAAYGETLVRLPTPKGDLVLHIDESVFEGQKVTLRGFVANESPVTLSDVAVEVDYIGESGKKLRVCGPALVHDPALECRIKLGDIAPKQAKIFDPEAASYWVRKNFGKQKIASINYFVSYATCTPKYEFVSSQTSIPGLSVSFDLRLTEGLALKMSNESTEPMEISWDDSSFINIGGDSVRVVHAGTKFVDIGKSVPNTVIPPSTSVYELVVPSDHVIFTGQEWRTTSLLPVNVPLDFNLKPLGALPGSSLGVYLRILRGNQKLNYLLKFTLKSVGV